MTEEVTIMVDQPIVINDLSWGEIVVQVEGQRRRFRDCKIWPGGAREWDWNETGTDHGSGIQVGDVREVVEKGAEVVILSRGQQRRLQVQDETEGYLREHEVEFHIEETNQAVDHFNQLSRQGKRVGGLFHTTC